jgi:photosystem II stability/assembly factor-like uncharacterized protein
VKTKRQVTSTLSLALLMLFITAGCFLITPKTTGSITPFQTATRQEELLKTSQPTKITISITQLPGTRTTSSGASKLLDFVKMISDTQGWGIANESILRTENGGRSWSNVTPTEIGTILATIPEQGLSSFKLQGAFLNTQNAWIAAPGLGKITVFQTSNSGLTWQANESVALPTPQEVYPILIDSFSFLNSQTGWLLMSKGMALGQGFVELYQTQNSGSSWRLVAEANQNASGEESGAITILGQKTGVSFRDTTNGWLTGYSMGNSIYLYSTKDGGLTWNFQPLLIPIGYTATGGSAKSYPPIFFNDKNGLMPIYLGNTTPGINLFFYLTDDGGDSWSSTTSISSPTNDFVWSWADYKHGFVAEEGKSILYFTSDSGKSWSTIMLSGLKISQLDFISVSIGWGISEGSLIQTLDGGKNWIKIYP